MICLKLTLEINLESIVILAIQCLLTHEYRMSFYVFTFDVPSVVFNNVLEFSVSQASVEFLCYIS